ncbi:MAG: formylglycine-generating enzyme family protein, partial [Lysobacterales bacterium]
RTEVTNDQFAEFLNALPVSPIGTALGGDLDPENIPEDHQYLLLQYLEPRPPYPIIQLDDEEARIGMRNGLFVANPGFENHPVAETTWAGAVTYCAWRGARLPTEVEWEAAARGKDGRIYPWGEAPPTTELAVTHRESGDTLPVGSTPRGATPKGLLDMAGSLQEWTSTLYQPYPYRSDDGREDLTQPGERVTRGGDYVFEVAPDKLTTWHRTGYSRRVSSGHRQIGFRCAANVSDTA